MKYYNYIYLDPRKMGNFKYEDWEFEAEPIYVGKGCGSRAYEHVTKIYNSENPIFKNKILAIQKEGLEPIIKILKYFEDEETAYDHEDMLIKIIGSDFIKEIKNGPLCNLLLGAKPPNHKGKTYEEIFGDNAEWQRKNRIELQKKAGGWFKGHTHSEESRKKMSENGKIDRALRKKNGWKLSEEAKKQISESRKLAFKNGLICQAKKNWKIRKPNGEIVMLNKDNKINLQTFCKENGICHNALQKTCWEDRECVRGKTMGWKLYEIKD